jgi:hypothetical protein
MISYPKVIFLAQTYQKLEWIFAVDYDF